jgi:hypothetical protein
MTIPKIKYQIVVRYSNGEQHIKSIRYDLEEARKDLAIAQMLMSPEVESWISNSPNWVGVELQQVQTLEY